MLLSALVVDLKGSDLEDEGCPEIHHKARWELGSG